VRLAAFILAAAALAACAPAIDRSPVGQFGIVRAPPLGCSETSGPPWKAVHDGDGADGFGYCAVDPVRPDRVVCTFGHCAPAGAGWRCGARDLEER
jgi:hypothetical protein